LQIPKGHVGVKKKLLADDKTTGSNDLLHSTNDVCGDLLNLTYWYEKYSLTTGLSLDEI
jgi:hypothetical protein